MMYVGEVYLFMDNETKRILCIPNLTRITLRIPARIKEKLIDQALKEKRSMNNMILTILDRYFSQESPN